MWETFLDVEALTEEEAIEKAKAELIRVLSLPEDPGLIAWKT